MPTINVLHHTVATGLMVTLGWAASTPVEAQIWPNAGNAEAARARAAESLEREAKPSASADRDVSAPRSASSANATNTVDAPDTAAAAAPPPPHASAAARNPAERASTPTSSILISQIAPREFGLTLGDTFTQRIGLPAGTPALANPAVDLRTGRVGTWFDRQSARRETDAAGRDWLLIEHQIINVPTAHRRVIVPAFSVGLKPTQRLEIGPARLGIGPLTPIEAVSVESVLASLRPDRAPPRASVPLALQRMRWSVAALVASMVTWLAWWRWREAQDARARPFARALRAVQREAHHGPSDQSARAWVALHHAFNAAANRSVHTASLNALFEHQPSLRVERDAIERFFAASNARFFKEEAPTERFDLLGLAQRLRQLERQTT